MLDQLVVLLPIKWQPKAKAIVAALIPVIVAIVNAIDTGLGWKEAAIAGGGVLLGLGVYATPNKAPHAAIEELT